MEIFRGGGGRGRGGAGVQARLTENSLDTVFVLSSTYFTVNREGPMVLLQRRQYCSKDPERVQYFPGGSNCFLGGGGGVQMLISIETHMTCDFPGVRTPYPHSGSAHDLVIYFFFFGGGISLQSIFTVKVGHL